MWGLRCQSVPLSASFGIPRLRFGVSVSPAHGLPPEPTQVAVGGAPDDARNHERFFRGMLGEGEAPELVLLEEYDVHGGTPRSTVEELTYGLGDAPTSASLADVAELPRDVLVQDIIA